MSELAYSPKAIKIIQNVLGEPLERCHVPSIHPYSLDSYSPMQPLCQGCIYKLPQGHLLVEDISTRFYRWGMTEIPSRVLHIHPKASQVEVSCPFIDKIVLSPESAIKSLLNQKADLVPPEQLTEEFLISISKARV